MKHRLADKILCLTPWVSLCGIKAVSFEEYSMRQPLGYEAALPESLAIGAVLEMGNWLSIVSSDYEQMAWALELEACQIIRVPQPGERLVITVEMLDRSREQVRFRGRATIAGEEALRLDSWIASLRPLAEYYDAGDLRVLCGQITEGC